MLKIWEKNSLTTTLPPLPDSFLSRETICVLKTNKQKTPLEKPNDPAQEKGFWIVFSASMTRGNIVRRFMNVCGRQFWPRRSIRNKGWSLDVGEGNKACSQKLSLGKIELELGVGGWRVRNAHRCQMSQVYMKQGDDEKRAQIRMWQTRAELWRQVTCGWRGRGKGEKWRWSGEHVVTWHTKMKSARRFCKVRAVYSLEKVAIGVLEEQPTNLECWRKIKVHKWETQGLVFVVAFYRSIPWPQFLYLSK